MVGAIHCDRYQKRLFHSRSIRTLHRSFSTKNVFAPRNLRFWYVCSELQRGADLHVLCYCCKTVSLGEQQIGDVWMENGSALSWVQWRLLFTSYYCKASGHGNCYCIDTSKTLHKLRYNAGELPERYANIFGICTIKKLRKIWHGRVTPPRSSPVESAGLLRVNMRLPMKTSILDDVTEWLLKWRRFSIVRNLARNVSDISRSSKTFKTTVPSWRRYHRKYLNTVYVLYKCIMCWEKLLIFCSDVVPGRNALFTLQSSMHSDLSESVSTS